MHTVRIAWGNVSIQLLSHGLLCALSMFDFIFYLIRAAIHYPVDGHTAPIACKLMPISKFCRNFWSIFSQTQFAVYLLYPAYPKVECRLQVGRIKFFWQISPYTSSPDHAVRMRSLNLPLRLLTENEIFRLSVWNNPTNETSRGSDLVGNTERTLLEARISIISSLDSLAYISNRHPGLPSFKHFGV